MRLLSIRIASLAICVVCLTVTSTQAGWGSVGGSSGGGSSGGSYGSYGSSGSVAYYSSYGSGGHAFTPVRSTLRGIYNHIAAKVERHHARRAAYASYGSSGYSTSYGSSGYSTSYGSSGYSTSYGSSGYTTSYGSSGYSTSYGSSGHTTSYGSTGSYGASYGSTGEVYYGASNTSVSNNPVVSIASTTTTNDAVYLTVNVPSAAKVYVNGKPTTSEGSVRQFVSRGLAAGKSYKFDVRAELMSADGQLLTEEKTIVLGAGSEEQMQFAFADTPAKIQTSLTLNVPEGATVTLAGNATKATGSERVFQSTHLKLGESWDEYEIAVEHEGVVKRQSIRLIGGDQLALTFDFDGPSEQLAAK